jgi:hypothetical protein
MSDLDSQEFYWRLFQWPARFEKIRKKREKAKEKRLTIIFASPERLFLIQPGGHFMDLSPFSAAWQKSSTNRMMSQPLSRRVKRVNSWAE